MNLDRTAEYYNEKRERIFFFTFSFNRILVKLRVISMRAICFHVIDIEEHALYLYVPCKIHGNMSMVKTNCNACAVRYILLNKI